MPTPIQIKDDMRFGNIEILRFFAASFVIVFHTLGGLNSKGFDLGGLTKLQEIAPRGVDLFFVISGFVIFRSTSVNTLKVADFIKMRLIRIVPSYWILTTMAILATFAATGIGLQMDIRIPDPVWITNSLFFTSQATGNREPILYQGWSLEYEMFFYGLIASLLWVRNILVRFSCLALCLFFAISLGMPLLILEFLLGAAVAYFYFRSPKLDLLWKAIFIIGLTVMLVLPTSANKNPLGSIALALACGAVVFGSVTTSWQTTSQVWLALGRISYPAYLIQWFTVPVITIAASAAPRFDYSWLLWLGLSLVLTQAFAFYFDLKIDTPFRKWLTVKFLN